MAESKSEKFWEIKAKNLPIDDPLLGCLVVLTRFEHRPFNAEALTAGLPLEDNKLTPELFIRAADRADLSAQILRRKLSNISPLVLPVVLLLKNKMACLLVGLKSGGIAEIIQPESGAGVHEIKLQYLQQEYTGYAIFVRPQFQYDTRAETARAYNPKHWLRRVMTKLIPIYAEILVASLMVNIFALGTPIFTMNVYDRVVPHKESIATLWVLALGLSFVYIFDFLMKILRGYFVDFAAKKADVLLSSAIYEQMMGVRMEARPESVGAFANNLSQFDSFREFLTSTTILVVIDLPFLVLFILVIYYLGGNLAWVPIVAVPLVLILGFMFQFPLDRLIKESYRYSSQKQAQLIETLIGAEAIKEMGAESQLQRKWESLIGTVARQQTKIKNLNALAVYLTAFVQQMAGVIIIIMGVYNIHAGIMTMGALIAVTMLNSRCLAPLTQIATIFTRYEQSITALQSVDKIMQMPVDRPPGRTPLYREHLDGNFKFVNVELKYPREDLPAVTNINFEINKSDKIAIVGPIGSGKSSLAKMLMGLYRPTAGQILIDGTDLEQLDMASLRRNIGYLPQDVTLFYGSVKDNIVMGAPYVDDQAILRAANIAGVTEFVSHHPKGFDMLISERGENISGGQRQSIALARALLLDPPILILDEPTNAMDVRTEQLVLYKLAHFIKDKTVILITHKTASLGLVSRIAVIDDGKLVAIGPRDAVLKTLSNKIKPKPEPKQPLKTDPDKKP